MSAVESLPDLLDVWQESINWQPDAAMLQQFQQLYAEILAGNRQLNLTRVTEPIDFWEKHLWDSLRGIAPFRNQNDLQVIDIGTGAGFPGLPIAIACPSWQVTLLDSTRKKVTFLETLARSLNLPQVKTRCDRVETVGRLWRDRFDLATIRAVAAAVACAEYALPLLKVGGTAILYRGQWTAEEADAIEKALPLLGGKLESIEMFETPLTYSIRHCLYLRKVAPTPKDFPRAIGLAVQKPLA
ncbi:16S rRNA (guanine(527)-N(7))-methyltransferase RsmG [Microcoleus sp. FACHB-1515]|uniref:16S rRNA (guanine(527)-N(7))-methyltransferase RsmG n=1 Tax=Cyanophyceae TaxID=3028117 RepID=UPI001686DB3D|nr:16S rRNA (guanine(527)-N(7))-methyltransferase RsmG [Microcoleus sp. FACHB-1515]MBD2088750.1 16S rRNA (guanine(527)-N(7))-methyltransferase RsmG [Microcoleus sp. FACHB-1515]